MDDLYDEFGNFIGDAEASGDQSQHGADVADRYLQEDESDDDAPVNDQQLMDLDGILCARN